MRIISRKTLKSFWEGHEESEKTLKRWYELTKNANWKNSAEVIQTFGSVDQVRVNSGNTVTVFDIGGNKYRVVAAIHYNVQTVYVLAVMTHAEYDKNHWKEGL